MMQNLPPHRTLMLLHRSVDHALGELLEPLGFSHATEGYVTVSRSELDALAEQPGDPQAVLAGLGMRAPAPALMVAEPSLSSSILTRIWRSDRNAGAPLTQVEGEILRQFLAKLVGTWSQAWAAEGIRLLPEVSMATSLAMLRPQLASGPWHVARTVVREGADGEPIGVLLFAYPDVLVPQLTNEARSTLWRARIDRGLSLDEQQRLHGRLAGPLRHVTLTAPVCIRQDMTLGMLNSLERGDVVAFDENTLGEITFHVLDREVRGRLAASGEQLALALSGAGSDAAATPVDHPEAGMPVAGSGLGYDFTDHDMPPDPTDWDLAS